MRTPAGGTRGSRAGLILFGGQEDTIHVAEDWCLQVPETSQPVHLSTPPGDIAGEVSATAATAQLPLQRRLRFVGLVPKLQEAKAGKPVRCFLPFWGFCCSAFTGLYFADVEPPEAQQPSPLASSKGVRMGLA